MNKIKHIPLFFPPSILKNIFFVSIMTNIPEFMKREKRIIEAKRRHKNLTPTQLEQLDEINQNSKPLREFFRDSRQEMSKEDLKKYLDLCEAKFLLTGNGKGTIETIKKFIKKNP